MKIIKKFKRINKKPIMIFACGWIFLFSFGLNNLFFAWVNDGLYNHQIAYYPNIYLSTGNRTIQDFNEIPTIFERHSNLYIWVNFTKMFHPNIKDVDINFTFYVAYKSLSPVPMYEFLHPKNASAYTFYICKFFYRNDLHLYESVINFRDFNRIDEFGWYDSWKDNFMNTSQAGCITYGGLSSSRISQTIAITLSAFLIFVVPQLIYVFYKKYQAYNKLITKIALRFVNTSEKDDELNIILKRHKDILKKIDKIKNKDE